jgi:alpha-D-xyloside xylohydrolase
MNAPLTTVAISAPIQNVLRIRNNHFMGMCENGPDFELHIADSLSLDLEFKDGEQSIFLRNGKLEVQINLNPYNLVFTYAGRPLTESEAGGNAYIRDNASPEKTHYMRERLMLGIGESIYGLGERFTAFVKNGQTVDTWNEDGGTGSEISYKNVPFYISSKGYGVFVKHPENVSFEIGSEMVSKVQFSVEGEILDYCIVGGVDMKGVLDNYTALTGRPALPPEWSYGLWLTTSFTTDYNEETITSFVDGMEERGIPLQVFHFDCFWMKGFHWCDFEWDSKAFPDPAGMLKRLKDRGLKICLWINPYIAGRSPLFKEGMQNEYFIKDIKGNVWQTDKWQAGMGIVDFTNPDATKWYKGYLQKLIDMGVDCFKTDFGERIPTDVSYFNGSEPHKMHNYYTFLYNKAVFELLEENFGEGEAVLFARSATAGCQQFPVHWGGDCMSTYSSMADTIRGGLSIALSGFPFWSHDISGFAASATPDLYKRWVAFGLLSSHSRLHGSNSYRVPWLFDEEAVDVLRHFVHLKRKLMPYILSTADEAKTKGLPLMRPMVLEFQNDRNCQYLDRQYMFGPDLLVAPILNAESFAEFYLPDGKWQHFLDGRILDGGRWYKEEYNYMSLPLFIRLDENSNKPTWAEKIGE